MILADNLASTNPFLFMIELFFVFIFIVIFVQCLMDLFADHEEPAGSKIAWVIFLILFTPITVLVYLIVRGPGMAKRNMDRQKAANQQFADYVTSVGAAGSPSEQIAKAKELLDAGTIDQAEFDKLKAKALA
ncbi:MAG TPA: SHOCT domain-containing protein [Acidimicrobiales bacterium]